MSATRPRLTAVARRQAVLDTACRVFSRSSYRGATTAEIAREAGITEPILYRHFGSKRDLYLGCLGAIADAYMAKKTRIRLVDLWIQALNEASDDAVIAKAVRRQIREVHAFFAGVIERGQELGSLNAERDPVAEAWIFVAGGLLATIDHRLGGLLGADLERVRASRRAYMR